jgi:hypothetical protein
MARPERHGDELTILAVLSSEHGQTQEALFPTITDVSAEGDSWRQCALNEIAASPMHPMGRSVLPYLQWVLEER